MKKKDIEKLLKMEIEKNVPDVLPNVLSTPIVKEKVKEEEKKADIKSYFQFRYMYVSLAMCAVLLIGIGFLLPSIRQNSVTTPNQTTENYTITTEITAGENNATIVADSLNKVSSVTVNGEEITLLGVDNLDSALELVVDLLISENAFDGLSEVTLNVDTSITKHETACYNVLKTNLETLFDENNIEVNIIKG